jgi:hypothetical protein
MLTRLNKRGWDIEVWRSQGLGQRLGSTRPLVKALLLRSSSRHRSMSASMPPGLLGGRRAFWSYKLLSMEIMVVLGMFESGIIDYVPF